MFSTAQMPKLNNIEVFLIFQQKKSNVNTNVVSGGSGKRLGTKSSTQGKTLLSKNLPVDPPSLNAYGSTVVKNDAKELCIYQPKNYLFWILNLLFWRAIWLSQAAFRYSSGYLLIEIAAFQKPIMI